jgi:serine/threonine protein kinase
LIEMPGEKPAAACLEFVAVAQREGLLAPESAANLSRQSSERGVSPAQLALQQGMLTPVQVEIIETLMQPCTAVAGYEILGLVGYGGMGIVYRARQISLGRIVALKTVLLGANKNPSRLTRFEQEAQTVGKLLHPHIVTAYDFGRDAGRLYLAMELVEGEDVERWIAREGPLTEAATWGLIRQAAAGLAHAAEFGVVHRDIKPANLLLVTPPKGFPLPPGLPMVKIADFGLALMTEDDQIRLTADHSAVGSPHYMAPEQLGRGEIDHRADLYALGATAYHMLVGRPPFDGLTIPQIFAQKLHSPPEPLANLRPDLTQETIALVEDMMARDPARRISNYAELIERIDRLAPPARGTPESLARPSSPTISTETRHGGGETRTNYGTLAEPPATEHDAPVARSLFEIAWRLAVAAALIIGMAYVVSAWRRPARAPRLRPGTDLVASGYAIKLFDSSTPENRWRTFSGDWQTVRDDDGAAVLAASSGVISRNFVAETSDRPGGRLEHYRIRFRFAIRDATAIELSFGMFYPGLDVESRSVLRVDRRQGVLGRQAEGTLQVVPIGSPVAWSLEQNRYYEMRVERQATEWRAYVDDQFVGAVPLGEAETQKFRIAVTSPDEQKVAWFKDFVVEELVPPEPASPSVRRQGHRLFHIAQESEQS